LNCRLAILAATACLIPLSFIAAPYPEELVLQHVLTVVGLLALGFAAVRWRISRISLACGITFILLHVVGARWIYSYVPYDDLFRQITGTSLAEHFDWRRNHYDRFVHFAFGLLCVPPAFELLQRFGGMRPRGAALMAVATVLAIGSIYEIMEWLASVTLSAEHAEAYNGQQGDLWDPQKDMLLAWLGAMIAAGLVVRWSPQGVRNSSP
jgi:putative membrane protein